MFTCFGFAVIWLYAANNCFCLVNCLVDWWVDCGVLSLVVVRWVGYSVWLFWWVLTDYGGLRLFMRLFWILALGFCLLFVLCGIVVWVLVFAIEVLWFEFCALVGCVLLALFVVALLLCDSGFPGDPWPLAGVGLVCGSVLPLGLLMACLL